MLNKRNTGQILICQDNEEFLKLLEDLQAQYLERHEKRVGKNE